MSDAKLANAIARERVDGLTACNGEPQWLKESRLLAWETYLQTPMPTARDEDWRKTEIDSLDLSQFVAVGPIKGKAKSQSQSPLLHSCTQAIAATAGLFTEDYQSQNQSITLDAALSAKGVVFLPLTEAVEKHPQLVEKYLSGKPEDPSSPNVSKFHQGQDDKFTLMNRALFIGGYFLYVPKGVTVEAPFLAFINLTGQKSEGHGQAFMERLIVVAEERSEVSLVTVFSSSDNSGDLPVKVSAGVSGKVSAIVSSKASAADSGKVSAIVSGQVSGQAATTKDGAGSNSTFANIFVEVHAGSGAKVNIVELSQFGQSVFAVSRTSTFVGRDGALDYTTASLGAKQIKSVIETILVDRGGQSDIKGIVLGHGSEHVSYNTIQEHAAPDTTSNINFRVALKDSAASIYQGIVKVDKIAQRTNAFQSNKNLLLGSEARADSIPKLEILADDVKCSHGATVGPVDKEQLFYLQSRGLSLKESEELIVTGFFAQVLNTITIKGVADWINALAAEKIHQ